MNLIKELCIIQRQLANQIAKKLTMIKGLRCGFQKYTAPVIVDPRRSDQPNYRLGCMKTLMNVLFE